MIVRKYRVHYKYISAQEMNGAYHVNKNEYAHTNTCHLYYYTI